MALKEYINAVKNVLSGKLNPESPIEKGLQELHDAGKLEDISAAAIGPVTLELDQFLAPSTDFRRYGDYRLMEIRRPEISKALDTISVLATGDIYVESSNDIFAEQQKKFLNLILDYAERKENTTLFLLIRSLAKYGDIYIEPIYSYLGNYRIFLGLRYHDPDYFRIVFLRNPSIKEKYGESGLKVVVYLIHEDTFSRTVTTIWDNYSVAYNRRVFKSGFPVAIYTEEEYQEFMKYAEDGMYLVLKEGEDIFHVPYNIDIYRPYGTSLLDSARYTFKQLELLEVIFMLFRLMNTPKLVWHVPVGTMDWGASIQYVQQIKEFITKQMGITKLSEQKVRMEDLPRYISMLDNIMIPQQEGEQITVDTLDLGKEKMDLEDYTKLLDKFYNGLKIPKHLIKKDNEGEQVTASILSEDSFLRYLVYSLRKPIEIMLERIILKQLEYLNNSDLVNATFSVKIKLLDEKQKEKEMLSDIQKEYNEKSDIATYEKPFVES